MQQECEKRRNAWRSCVWDVLMSEPNILSRTPSPSSSIHPVTEECRTVHTKEINNQRPYCQVTLRVFTYSGRCAFRIKHRQVIFIIIISKDNLNVIYLEIRVNKRFVLFLITNNLTRVTVSYLKDSW